MEKNKFYGTTANKAISYLEFGSIDLSVGEKNIWDFRLHDKAYDWLMHARYSHDIYSYLTMRDYVEDGKIGEIFKIFNTEVHHQDDAAGNLGKLIALMIFKNLKKNQSLSFFEIGQTLFGCIDGMEFYQQLLKSLQIDFLQIDMKDVEWYGVDISAFFNRMSKVVHEKYKIETFLELSELKEQTDVFFAKGVTLLYACDSISKLFEVLNKSKFGTFDYSFSLKGEQEEIIGTGKLVKFFDVREFMNRLSKTNKVIYVKKGNSHLNQEMNRAWLDCIYGEDSLCEAYIDLDIKIRKQVSDKLAKFDNSTNLLNADSEPNWIRIEDFI